jgi:transcriptional regulator NrdR family protein
MIVEEFLAECEKLQEQTTPEEYEALMLILITHDGRGRTTKLELLNDILSSRKQEIKMKEVFRIINKANDSITVLYSAREVGTFMLGRMVDSYIVIKSLEDGVSYDDADLLIKFNKTDFHSIVSACSRSIG